MVCMQDYDLLLLLLLQALPARHSDKCQHCLTDSSQCVAEAQHHHHHTAANVMSGDVIAGSALQA